tara:strand:- start:72 stop:404 length:333 start_codon:yes stop_codon:yes gene_type:complete
LAWGHILDTIYPIMKLSTAAVKKIAELARLALDSKETTLYAGQMSDVLAYFEKLNKVDTKDIEVTAQVTGLENITRIDKDKNCDAKIQKSLLEQAPERDGGLVKAKSVFN